MTAVASTVFTAAQFNAHIRDNLLETAPGKATTAGRIFVATGANAIAERAVSGNVVSTSEGTASTSFTDLTTPGPSTGITTGTSVIVALTAHMANSSAGGINYMGVDISGATTSAAADDTSVVHESGAANDETRQSAIQLMSGLNAGANTFTAKYRVTAGTGTFKWRRIVVMPFGS